MCTRNPLAGDKRSWLLATRKRCSKKTLSMSEKRGKSVLGAWRGCSQVGPGWSENTGDCWSHRYHRSEEGLLLTSEVTPCTKQVLKLNANEGINQQRQPTRVSRTHLVGCLRWLLLPEHLLIGLALAKTKAGLNYIIFLNCNHLFVWAWMSFCCLLIEWMLDCYNLWIS
jgi:hypothetical protein